jgi:hypothetical protein
MSEISAIESAEETKACKVCAEPIKKAARVCTHCNNYQDWRAELNLSSTMLSLLVALFSILTVALPAIKKYMTSDNSNLSFYYQGTNTNAVSVLVANNGNRPGTVRYPITLNIKMRDTAPGQTFSVPLSMSVTSSNAIIVQGGKSVLLDLKGTPRADLVDTLTTVLGPLGRSFFAECNVSLSETNFDQPYVTSQTGFPVHDTPISIPVGCKEVFGFVNQLKDASTELKNKIPSSGASAQERVIPPSAVPSAQQPPSATSLPAAKQQ